jgi:hypothetical protein
MNNAYGVNPVFPDKNRLISGIQTNRMPDGPNGAKDDGDEPEKPGPGLPPISTEAQDVGFP